MKCMETRKRHGLRWRRYRAADGAHAYTYEVPATRAGLDALAAALAADNGPILARVERNARMAQLLREGWKTVAVAHEVGVCDETVRRFRNAAQP